MGLAMNRFYAATFLASATALALGACNDDDQSASYSSGGGYYADCSQYTTCGSCTPVAGCGWCFNATGGACTTHPDRCAYGVSEFTWTWDPSGCPGVDASVVPLDAAGGHTQTSDGGGASSEVGAPADDAGHE
jgi:hypothetical protein